MAADTYSALLGLLLMGTGNDNNTWGTNANNSVFQIIEDAITGALVSAVTGGTLDLSASPPPAGPSQARYAALTFTGVLASNQIVQVPNLRKAWLVNNGTSGAFTLTIKTPTGVASTAIPQNSGWQMVYCDGADAIVVWPFNTKQIQMPDGSAALPAYSNVNEKSSGLYRLSAGVWRFAISGTDVFEVSAGTLKALSALTVNGTLTFSGTIGTASIANLAITTAKIALNNVTYATMQQVSAQGSILGRKTAGAGNVEEVTKDQFMDLWPGVAQGDILVRGASTWSYLAPGTSGYVLQSNGAGATPSYNNVAATTITKIGKTSQGGGSWYNRHYVTNDNRLFSNGISTGGRNGCIGFDTHMPLPVAFNTPPAAIQKVVYGYYATYVLDSAGHVFAFGNNNNGCLGQGDTVDREVATRIEFFVTNGITIADVITPGNFYSQQAGGVFFISSTGALYACGFSNNGSLGLNTAASTSFPTPTLTNLTSGVASVSFSADVGLAGAYAIKTDNTLWYTGTNSQGVRGDGVTVGSTIVFTQVNTGVAKAQLIMGQDGDTGNYGWGIILKTNGTIWTAGWNSHGQLGVGSTTSGTTWAQVGGATNWTDFCSGGFLGGFTLAINSLNEMWCWGYNGAGNLGMGDLVDRTSPVKPVFASQGSITKIICANGFTYPLAFCLDSSGYVWAAGYNTQGALGLGGTVVANNTTFAKCAGQDPTRRTLADWTICSLQNVQGLTVLWSDGTASVTGTQENGVLGIGGAVANAAILNHLVQVPRFA